jgi:ABC-type branched-subunit amino acid transport system substrate-binding protein
MSGRAALPALVFALVAGVDACTLLVDASIEQCSTTADCLGKGAAFSGTVCTDKKICEQPPCTSNKDCAAYFGSDYAICRKDNVCVKLFSEDCKKILGDPAMVLDDNTIWLGTMLPVIDTYKTLGLPLQNGVEIAQRDFKTTTNGLPPATAGGARRPYAFVACHDLADPVRAATHLVDDLRVPAIIGPAFSGVLIKIATTITIPKGVLIMSPSATSPFISGLADNGLVWRTAPPDTVQAVAIAFAMSAKVEPDLRAGTPPVLKTLDPLRLAVVHKGDAYGKGLADALFAKVLFNGKTAAQNDSDGNYKRIDYGDPDDPANTDPKSKYQAAVATTLAFKPHVVIVVGTTEGVTDIFGPIESGWSAGTVYRPRFVLTDGAQVPELTKLVGSNADLRKRTIGTVPGTTSEQFKNFASRYRADPLTADTNPDQYTAAAYDAAYLLAYAIAAVGPQPITGATLAEGLKRMVPPGRAIEIGPGPINDAFAELAAGKNIDVNGVSGPLDFDVKTGEAESDIQIWCIDINTSGMAVGFKNSGAYYDSKTKTLVGTVVCP